MTTQGQNNNNKKEEIINEINKARVWENQRYNIDRQLIENGYSPAEIDAAWPELNITKRPNRILRFLTANSKLWFLIFNFWAILYILLFASFLHLMRLRVFSQLGFLFIFLILFGAICFYFCYAVKGTEKFSHNFIPTFKFWFLSLILIGLFNFYYGNWLEADVLNTQNGNYYLLVEDAHTKNFIMVYDGPVEVEIYSCIISDIFCLEVQRDMHSVNYSEFARFNWLKIKLDETTGKPTMYLNK